MTTTQTALDGTATSTTPATLTGVLQDIGAGLNLLNPSKPGSIGQVGASTLANPAGAAASVAGSVASAATSGVLAPLGRILLYVAFVLGGIVLVILGLQRLTGGKASPIPVPVPV